MLPSVAITAQVGTVFREGIVISCPGLCDCDDSAAHTWDLFKSPRAWIASNWQAFHFTVLSYMLTYPVDSFDFIRG